MPGSESQANLGNEFLPAGCFIPVGGRRHEMKKKKERKSLQTTLTLRRKRYQRQGENGVPACHSNLRWERCQAASWGQGRGQPSQEPTANRNAPHSKSPSSCSRNWQGGGQGSLQCANCLPRPFPQPPPPRSSFRIPPCSCWGEEEPRKHSPSCMSPAEC